MAGVVRLDALKQARGVPWVQNTQNVEVFPLLLKVMMDRFARLLTKNTETHRCCLSNALVNMVEEEMHLC